MRLSNFSSEVLIHAQQVVCSGTMVVRVVAQALLDVLPRESKSCSISDNILVYENKNKSDIKEFRLVHLLILI